MTSASAEGGTTSQQRLDPFLRIPFQTCPKDGEVGGGALTKNWGTLLDPRALYFVRAIDQVVGTSQKSLCCFVSRDSIYFGKVERGKLEKTPTVCRRILFSSIRKIVTNICRPGNPSPVVIMPSNFFLLFLLSPQEKCDCIVVGMECKELLATLVTLWDALRLGGKIPIEERPKERSFKESSENYRVPQSSRVGEVDPLLKEIVLKDAVDDDYKKKMEEEAEASRRVQEDFPESPRASSASPRGDKRVSFAADALASPERTASVIAMKAASTRSSRSAPESYPTDPLLDIPYVSFSESEAQLFPGHGKADRAILFLARGVFFYRPVADAPATSSSSSSARGSFAPCFLYLTRDAVYVGDSERTLARCAKLQRLTAAILISDIQDLLQVGDVASGAAVGVVLQFTLGEPDLLVAFPLADSCNEFIKTLTKIMKGANPNVVFRQRTAANVREAKVDLRVAANFTPDILHVPSRQTVLKEHQKASAASASMLSFGDIPTVRSFSSPPMKVADPPSSTSGPGDDDDLLRDDDDDDDDQKDSPIRRQQSKSSPSLTRNSETSKSNTVSGRSNSMRPMMLPPPTKTSYVGLASMIENDDELYKEFYVSSDIRKQCPMLEGKKVAWAGQVVHRPAPLVKQAGQQPAALVVAFLTETHLVIALEEDPPRRVLPLKKIKLIRVQTRPRGPGEPSRQIIVLVMDDPEFDLCLEVPREDDGKVLLNQLFNVLKRVDPYQLPAVKPFVDIEKEDFHFDVPKFYKQEKIALEESGESKRKKIHFKAAVYAFFEKYDPGKLKNAEKIAEEHIGREQRLAEKLKKKYGHALEDVADPQGFRTRLARFCHKYLPDSATMIDDVLYEYQGREEQLFASLVARFGPEPNPSDVLAVSSAQQAAASGGEGADGGASNDRVHRRLVNIYRKYQPDRLNSIKEILTKYRGKEEQLFRRLVKLYGPEPPPDFTFQTPIAPAAVTELKKARKPVTFRDRVLVMAKKYFPKRVDSVDAVCAGYTTTERQQELITGLIEKYGPEPVYPSAELKEQLRVAIEPYRQQQPFSSDELESIIINSYSAPQATEESFLAFIEGKIYDGSLPDILPASSSGSMPSGSASPRTSATAKLSQDPQLSENLDALAELPYIDVPRQVEHLYPNLRKAAVFWFETVQHWEPPFPPALHHAFITPSHLYLSDSEQRVIRCISLDFFRAIYINTKRDDQDSKCSVLVKLSPAEHDLFLSFASDELGKKFVWVALEVLLKYRFNQTTAAFTVKGFNEPGMEPVQLRRPEGFVLTVAPLSKRQSSKTQRVDEAAREELARRQASVRLLSAMHDSLLQQADDADTNAEWERKQAALLLRSNRGLIELTQRDKKLFGTVPASKLPGAKLATSGQSTADDDGDTAAREQLRQWARQGQFGEASDKVIGRSTAGEGEEDAFANRRIHLAQKLQFLRHSVDGRYGRAADLSQWEALEHQTDPLESAFTEKETQAGRDYAVGSAPIPPRFLRGDGSSQLPDLASSERADAAALVSSSVEQHMLGNSSVYERVRRLVAASSSPPFKASDVASRPLQGSPKQHPLIVKTPTSSLHFPPPGSQEPRSADTLHNFFYSDDAQRRQSQRFGGGVADSSDRSKPLLSHAAVDMLPAGASRGELLFSSEVDLDDPSLYPLQRQAGVGPNGSERYELLFASHYPTPGPPEAAALDMRSRGLLFAASAPSTLEDSEIASAAENRSDKGSEAGRFAPAAQAFDIGYL